MFIALTLKRAQKSSTAHVYTQAQAYIDSRHEESQDVVVVVYRRGEEIDINSHFSDVVIQSTLRQGDFHHYVAGRRLPFHSNLKNRL